MFIPLHDHNKIKHVYKPFVNWALLAANVFVFVVIQHAGFGDAATISDYSYGLISSVLFDMKDLTPDLQAVPDAATLVTYAFLHGDWMHLIGNMLFLWVFGDNVEDAMGHVRYLVFYLACAAGAGFAYAITSFGSDAPLIGASGATAGIIVAYLMLHPHVKIWILALGRIPLRLSARWVLGAWIVLQVYNVVVDQDSNVAWSAHIGGLITGAILVLFLRRRGVPLFDKNL
ncbi:rhomboid family intramembrane serine protease [uncultured Roseibium sp.]|uniref:rhomboid family intramembrane serine protease n=1 Tax=uncultured Roseibium sp. TaxID=1936171 RepID=UPI0032164177